MMRAGQVPSKRRATDAAVAGNGAVGCRNRADGADRAGRSLILAGRDREKNLFYQVVRIIPSPFVKLTRLLTPKVFEDRVIPFATFCILSAIFLWLAFAIPQVAP